MPYKKADQFKNHEFFIFLLPEIEHNPQRFRSFFLLFFTIC